MAGSALGGARASVDGTDFAIPEPGPFDKKWFSHKFKGPGLRHEIGICISTGRIVWAHGPFPCGACADVLIFRKSKGMKLVLAKDEMVIGDKGHSDDNCITGDDQQLMPKRIFERAKARHETVNGRLKQFFVLGHKFRHGLSRHSACFFAVLNLTQLMIDDGAPLFEP